MKKTHLLLLGLSVFTLTVTFQSCYYDNEEDLYPNENTACDTAVFSYTGKVKSIMDTYCATAGCHNATTHAAGYYLDTYDNVKTSAQDPLFMCSIRRESGCSPMPKAQSKLSDCNITIIQKWIDNNYPN
jgi:hypothetical protein